MNGKCLNVLYYGHVILNEWEMLLCALLWACNTEWMGTAFLCFIMGMEYWMNGKCLDVLYYGHVILNEWEMLLCALLWACNTEWMGNAFLCFIMGM